MKKTILVVAVITTAVFAAPHGMEIVGPNSSAPATGTVDSGLNGTDLTIVQRGLSSGQGSHDHAYTFDLSSLAGQDGNHGKDGRHGTDGNHGSDGKDGVDGAKGATGATGATGKGVDGKNGKDGSDGAKGNDGSMGSAGNTGSDGDNGSNGRDGYNGVNGIDGIDGRDGNDFNAGAYRAELNGFVQRQNDLIDYTATVAAAAIATSSIDFGTVAEGGTEVGVGIGVSSGDFYGTTETGYAGAVGLKHGLTEEDAAIVKAWAGKNSAYGVGAGLTHRF